MGKLIFSEPDGGFNAALNPGIAAAVIGSAVVGGVMSSQASSNAADAQSEAANRASDAQGRATAETNRMQMEMYRQNLANESPYLQAGQTAQAALMQGLGLGQLRATAGVTPDEFGQGGITNYGASQAELNQGAGSIGPGQLNRPFAPSDLTTDPSYQWRLGQGQRSLESSAAARGGLLTGQGAADITNYGQGAASQEYSAAFDRNRTTQNDLYNRLSNLAGIGQTATGAISGYGQNAANQMGANTMMGAQRQGAFGENAGQAQASGAVGSANAWGGALRSGAADWARLQGQGSTPGGTGYDYLPNTAAINQGQLYGPPNPYPDESIFSGYTG